MVSPSQSGEPLLRAGCQNMCAHRASASRRRIRRVAKGVAERGGRHVTRAVFQHLDERHVRRRAFHFVAMAHEAEEPRRRASASTSAVGRVLPTPGSPDTMTIDPRPARAASRPARSSKRAVSRPTSGKRVLPRPIDGTTGAAEERPDSASGRSMPGPGRRVCGEQEQLDARPLSSPHLFAFARMVIVAPDAHLE